MARQTGDIRITGTVEGITFYKMGGVYYAREKSSLTGRRVKKDPRFARTMESAGRLALGSQLASRVYRALGKERRVYALYCTMKQMATLALKEGKGEAEVLAMMREYLADAGVVRKARCKKAMRPPQWSGKGVFVAGGRRYKRKQLDTGDRRRTHGQRKRIQRE